MKEYKMNSRTILILAIFMVSSLLVPSLPQVAAQDDSASFDDLNSPGDVRALQMALGQMFGMFRQFGASGETLAQVFELMFTDFTTLNNTKVSDGVFVLNASIIKEPELGQIYYDETNGTWTYQPWGLYRLDNATDPNYRDEHAYFKFSNNGTVLYNKTEGVSITLTIWDSDNSFVDAVDEMLTAIRNFIEIDQSNTTDEEKEKAAIAQAVKTISYFLIHINDIITGDEVIIANVIGFTNYVADILGNYTAEWYVTENGIQTDQVKLVDVYPDFETDFRNIANKINDDKMLFILDQGWNTYRQQNYTAFSFDVIELWLKNFHIEIDVNALLQAVQEAGQAAQMGVEYDGGPLADKTLTDIFDGLDIEFYVLTHHFQNWYLYDDSKFDHDYYSDEVRAKANNGVPDIVTEKIGEYNNSDVDVIVDSEVTHYMLVRGADQWIFNEPTYSGSGADDTFKMEWGIEARGLAFRCLPIGMNDDEVSLDDAPVEKMSYYKLGFSFSPKKSVNTVQAGQWTGTGMGMAQVKLVQEFGEWNNGNGPKTPDVKNSSLDLATVFMSTVFHFHLHIENKKISNTTLAEDDPLLSENNYNKSSHQINIGTAAGEAAQESGMPLAQIDIAGPDYQQTNSQGTTTSHPANTNLIPRAYAKWEGESSQTYVQKDESTAALSGILTLEFSVLLYAVAYDTFDSSGDELVHDPTFTVFISTSNPFAWAIVLVIGSLTLVGVAALLITKSKNKKAGINDIVSNAM